MSVYFLIDQSSDEVSGPYHSIERAKEDMEDTGNEEYFTVFRADEIGTLEWQPPHYEYKDGGDIV